MSKLAFFFVTLFLALLSAGASEPMSPKDLVDAAIKAKTLPESAAWRMDFEIAKGSDDPGWGVKSITSTRAGNIQRDVILWTDGRTSEAWWMGGDYLANDPRRDTILYSPERKPLSVLGWISWIDEKNFKGIEKRDDGAFGVFEAQLAWTLYWPGYYKIDSEGVGRLRVEALFSVDDGHLVSVRNGNVIGRFTRLAPPTEALAAPDQFIQKQKTIRERIARKFPRMPSAD